MTDAVMGLYFPFPLLSEQKIITQIINSSNTTLEQLKNVLSKFKKIKVGLMQDLLSGNVSVTPLLEGLNLVNTSNQKQTKEDIDKVLDEIRKENLLLIPGNGSDIVIGVPHHAPLGVSNLPCPEHPDADENAGYLGAEVARWLDCNCVIACNARKDPNKSKETEYSQQILAWKPRILVEIHGHRNGSTNFDIEISCGTKDRESWSLELEEKLKKKMAVEPLSKNFTLSGDFGRIKLKATKSYTITAREWVALHIELPKSLRQSSEMYLPFCKILAESVKELMENFDKIEKS